MVKYVICNKSKLSPSQKERLSRHCEVVSSDLAVLTKGYEIIMEGEVLGDKNEFSVRLNKISKIHKKTKKGAEPLGLPDELLNIIYKRLSYIEYRHHSNGEYIRHFIK